MSTDIPNKIVKQRLLEVLSVHKGLAYPYNSLFYYNRDKKIIRLHWPGYHVLQQFKTRIEIAKKVLGVNFNEYEDLFKWCMYKSQRVNESELTDHLKKRKLKYKRKENMNSLYLEHKSGLFRFIINHNKIVTFELCGALTNYN